MPPRDFRTALSKHLMEVKLFYQTKTAKLGQNLQRIEMCPNFEINVYFSKLKQLNEISLWMRSSCYVNINFVDCMKSECIRFYFQSIKIQIESNLSKMGFIHNLKLDLIFTRGMHCKTENQIKLRRAREINICFPSCFH